MALVTHKELSLSKLSELYFKDVPKFLLSLKTHNHSGVLLQTCNRIELYTYNQDPREILNELKINEPFLKSAKILKGFDVFKHLSRVACGLESLAIGEAQIIGQVRKAYKLAEEANTITSYLKLLFDEALRIGKKVRSKVKIAGLDYISATVKIIREELPRGSSIAVIGTGDAAIEIMSKLSKLNHYKLYLAGRNKYKVDLLSKSFGANPLSLNDLSILNSVDGLVVAIASDYKIELNTNRNVVAIDLGVPPNLVKKSNVKLYTMENLSSMIEDNKGLLAEEIKKAEESLKEELEKLRHKLLNSMMEHVIGRIYREAERIREEEVRETLNKIKGKESFTKEEFEEIILSLSRSMIKKLYHHHTEELRDLALKGKLDEKMLSLILKLFIK
ncbi:MAG: hypothetical protein QXX95_07570 [Nitrososphaerales archaeon]